MVVHAQQSATCVLLRDATRSGAALARPGEGLEVLLLQRNTRLAFHGGAWVFPGGRVDAADVGADELSRAKNAARRETLEEAGLDLGTQELAVDAHWVTPEERPKRFRTWFFWAAAPAKPIQVDGGEVLRHRWLTPARALTLHQAGDLELPPPTFVTLTKLLPFSHFREAIVSLQGRAPEYFTPRPLSDSDGTVSLYEGDAGYESRDVFAPGARRRLLMPHRGAWRFEVSD